MFLGVCKAMRMSTNPYAENGTRRITKHTDRQHCKPTEQLNNRCTSLPELVYDMFAQKQNITMPRGSKYPIFEASGSKYHTIFGIWALEPQLLGTWTLWDVESPETPVSDTSEATARSPHRFELSAPSQKPSLLANKL